MDKEKILLKVDGTGNKYENYKEFESSYFHEQYTHAIITAKNIIEQSNRIKGMPNQFYQNQEICNIISFIGGRGSGKTSAMLSFAGELQDFWESKREEIESKRKEINPYDFDVDWKIIGEINFTCLECIDGSLLEKKEDIFKVVLAQMYSKFQAEDRKTKSRDKNYDYDRRELQIAFEQVYHGVCKLERNDWENWNEASITNLKDLANSVKIKSEFSKLVTQYLEFLNRDKLDIGRRESKNQDFLVIVIDDLDLNIDNGFDMLEKVHRYMMVPQVIVLLTFDLVQIKMLCEKHFFDMIPRVNKIMEERRVYAEKLAQEFIEKVFPLATRIYMPLIKRSENVYIREGAAQKEIKETLFLEIYKKVGMRLDNQGKKRHFYEPDSLRGLVNFYLMLRDMPDTAFKEEKSREYKRNYNLFFTDIANRMVNERLNIESKELFERLVNVGLVRCCRNIVLHAQRCSVNGSDLEKSMLKDLGRNIEKYGYSYGELLRTLYCWGRVDEQSKEIVRCLMAYLSLEMKHVHYLYCNGLDKNAEQEIKEIINGSATGSWSNKMFPNMIPDTELEQKEVRIGTVQDVDLSDVIEFSFTFPKGLPKISEWDGKDSFGECEEELKKAFRTVVAISLFYSQPYYKNQRSYSWDFKRLKLNELENEDQKTAVQDSGYMNPAMEAGVNICYDSDKTVKRTFNMFNFVTNIFEWREHIKNVQTALYYTLFSREGNDGVLLEKETSFMELIGITKEFEEWSEYSKGFVFPLCDLDLNYNLMKRVRLNMFSIPQGGKKSSEILSHYTDILNNVRGMLERSDKYYQSLGIEQDSLSKKYENCPYIKWFNSTGDYFVCNFKEIFSNMLLNLAGADQAESIINESIMLKSYDDY